jgi:LPS sulfotransferase NodH
MNQIPYIFQNPALDFKRLHALSSQQDPQSRYIIAITPRSGSSYLCDLMTQIDRFGMPNELINQDGLPKSLREAPGRTPDEYLRHILRNRQTENGISGLKASWFQFENFAEYMDDRHYLANFNFIYLTRRDLAAQAVSLYKAVATGIFHTDTKPTADSIARLESLEYDYVRIKYWYDHIVAQEKGWQAYFYENRIYPLCISYEDIENDTLKVLRRIASYVGEDTNSVFLPISGSIFKKIRNHISAQWTRRFAIELSLNGKS